MNAQSGPRPVEADPRAGSECRSGSDSDRNAVSEEGSSRVVAGDGRDGGTF